MTKLNVNVSTTSHQSQKLLELSVGKFKLLSDALRINDIFLDKGRPDLAEVVQGRVAQFLGVARRGRDLDRRRRPLAATWGREIWRRRARVGQNVLRHRPRNDGTKGVESSPRRTGSGRRQRPVGVSSCRGPDIIRREKRAQETGTARGNSSQGSSHSQESRDYEFDHVVLKKTHKKDIKPNLKLL